MSLEKELLMDNKTEECKVFPESLFDWGNSGGVSVCRCSDDSTGWQKPPLKTLLIRQMETLAAGIRAGSVAPQGAIFLVGGPGNGKTHAAKYFQQILLGDEYSYKPADDNGVVSYNVSSVSGLNTIRFIEDASAGQSNDSVYQRFVDDVEEFATKQHKGVLFICCVNRGILATVLARIAKHQMKASDVATEFISRMSSVVSPDAAPTSLWPLAGMSHVYIHPMDEESLLESIDGEPPIASAVLDEICAVNVDKCLTCASACMCPLFTNLKSIQDKGKRASLLKILRYYEIVASKRLSFRDLFSIFSILIVGNQYDYVLNGKKTKPCLWVENQIKRLESNQQLDSLSGSFELEMMLYQNRLFANWKDFKRVDRNLLKTIKSAKYTAIADTHDFFKSLAARVRKSSNVASQGYLEHCAELLDPSLQDTTQLEDLDEGIAKDICKIEDSYCKSLTLGIETFSNAESHACSAIESRFMLECAKVEQNPAILNMSISDGDYALSQTVLSALRIVLSRIAKRSIGADKAFVYLGSRLAEFRSLLNGDVNVPGKKRKICQTIQEYLFPRGIFRHSMLATFGQSEPDAENGFFLNSKRAPRFSFVATNVTSATKNLLFVKEPDMGLTIKVNFDLYSALIDLQTGLSPASLPERIFDIFDGIKARIQGHLAHNWDSGDMSFTFPDRDRNERKIQWSEDEGFYED